MPSTTAATTTEPPLKRMFEAVPGRYDLLNRLLTLRLDERWRRRAAQRCLAEPARRVLDLGCGTGDLALLLARQANPGTQVVGLDYSPGMLEVARRKAAGAGLHESLRFVEGNAARMAFPDGCFDAAGIAFAFRNLTWRNPVRDEALAEVHRVLRVGGRFVIVETSQPVSLVLKTGFRAYLRTVVAPLGGLVSGRDGAYRYLAESARGFYDADQVSDMLREAGFEPVSAERLFGGIAAIHVGIKPAPTTS